MQQDLADKVALVTGGSDGIGLATAALLARRGAQVVICGRRPEQLETARARIAGEGGKIEAVTLDVTDFPAFEALIADIAACHGRLDMLVNNAMSTHYAPISRLKLEHWRKDFAVNADAVFVGTKAAMAVMAAQGSGSIVNISSTTAIRAMANYSSYSASKAALIQFTAVAAMEGAPQGIRVNAIVPGQVNTAATLDFAAKAPQLASRTADAIPMRRGGEPEELAEAIVFMLSDAASYITGVALPVDGGKAAQLYIPS
ncbi:2,5-dichloro-2,5-cyclohexadiene-1,4-diol dehydrogenase [Porphyrobacter sp. HT-58-2]|uniref:SDR family NAD(P)-dependent oxidoreductase n=1 Tax=Porphyrobacter sp. HT-58-2 TaxID=2023229 RepID=UPI000CDC278F|nr:SDR family NAD(P)-dependent oxidoreductase [Porphyrobacter sp. HT-58-2]AUX69009.1 2,5-dichloro-2,5-cyclohexadiene-1,4-diol dehydrogenase [Porphyrobacter sp. HT-58-2]